MPITEKIAKIYLGAKSASLRSSNKNSATKSARNRSLKQSPEVVEQPDESDFIPQAENSELPSNLLISGLTSDITYMI